MNDSYSPYRKFNWREGSDQESKISGIYSKLKRTLRDTPAEIFIIGGLCMALAGGFSAKYESLKQKKIPLGFSEITQIEKDTERENQGKNILENPEGIVTNKSSIGEVTEYYAKANDTTMKIFENSNTAWARTLFGDNHRAFASELEYNMDPHMKIHHYNLAMLLDELPELAQKAYKKMADLSELRLGIKTVNESLDNAWEDSHIDHYRTEHYTETVYYTDGQGKMHSKTVQKTRQVYDHTTHTYVYSPEYGEKAARLMSAVTNKYPNLKWPEEMKVTKQTNADGEYAAEQSRKKEYKQKIFGKEELLRIANTWNFGSAYGINKCNVLARFNNIAPSTQHWASAKKTAHSISYNTGSRLDSGPSEFQVAEQALQNGRSLEDSLDNIFTGIEKVSSQAPKLKATIEEYISTVLDGKKGNPNRLRAEIIQTGMEWYELNFPQGFNVNRSNYLNSFFWAIGGLVMGCLLGAGLDKLGDKRDWYGKKPFN